MQDQAWKRRPQLGWSCNGSNQFQKSSSLNGNSEFINASGSSSLNASMRRPGMVGTPGRPATGGLSTRPLCWALGSQQHDALHLIIWSYNVYHYIHIHIFIYIYYIYIYIHYYIMYIYIYILKWFSCGCHMFSLSSQLSLTQSASCQDMVQDMVQLALEALLALVSAPRATTKTRDYGRLWKTHCSTHCSNMLESFGISQNLLEINLKLIRLILLNGWDSDESLRNWNRKTHSVTETEHDLSTVLDFLEMLHRTRCRAGGAAFTGKGPGAISPGSNSPPIRQQRTATDRNCWQNVPHIFELW